MVEGDGEGVDFLVDFAAFFWVVFFFGDFLADLATIQFLKGV